MKQTLLIVSAVVIIMVIVIGVLVASSHHTAQAPSGTASSGSSGKAGATRTTSDGLKITDNVVGTGAVANASSTVTVDYTGTLDNGTVFDSTAKDGGQPATFALNQMIKGWQEGIPGMKVGGTRTLVIPGDLAYGANPPSGSGIPVNATLTFVIKLLKVN